MENINTDAARLWAVGFVCLAGPALISLVSIGVTPALPAMASYFDAGANSVLFAQMIMTLPAIMMIVGAPISGFVAERVGRRNCLLGSLILFVLSGTAGLYVSDYWILVVTRLLLGLGAGGVMTSFLALIGEYYEGHDRERMLGFASAAGSFISVLLLAGGGELVDQFGWRAPFAFYLSALLVVPAAWYGVHAGKSRKNDVVRQQPISVLNLWPFYLLLFLFTIGMYTPGIQLPFLLQEKGVSSAATQGSVIAVSSFVAAVGSFCYGYMRRYLGERAMYLWTACAFGIGIIAIALSSGPLAIAAWSVLMGTVMGTVEPTTASAILKRTPDHTHDRAMGLLVSALFMGQFVNPWVFDPLRRAFGIENAFLIVGTGFMAIAVIILSRKRLVVGD